MKRSRQITVGAFLSYLSVAFSIAAGLLYTPWMVRQIGQSQYGLYTLASSLIGLFLVDFGLSSATARYVSRYHAQGDEEKVNAFLGTVYRLYLIIDAAIFIALIAVYFCTDTIYKNLTAEELSRFRVVYLMAAGFSVIQFPFTPLSGVLSSYELFVQQKLADLLQRALTILLVVAALLNGMGLYALVAANAAAGLAAIVLRLWMIRRHTGVRAAFRPVDRGLLKELFGFSAWITAASLAQRLIFNVTPSILAVVASSSAIAVFGIVTTVEGYTFTITNAINGMFMPKVSRIEVGGDRRETLQPLLLLVGRFQYALNGLILAGFAVVGREFILLWMGEGFVDVYGAILLVLVPGLFYNSLQIGHTAVVVQNRVRVTALVNIAAGAINVGLSCFLSKRWGVLGAGLSICTAYLFRTAALLAIYHRTLPLDIPAFCRKCYLAFAPVIVITVLVGFLIKRLLPIGGWLSLAVHGGAVCLVYAGLTMAIGLNEAEKDRLKALIKKRP